MTALDSTLSQTITPPAVADLRARTNAAAAAAAAAAESVDRESRFPREAFTAIRENRLLSMLVPREFGGDGAKVSDVVDVCYALGMSCGSTAMIFAMHQIQVVILVRHARNSPWHQQLLRRLSADQLLFASSTTENQTGGAVRASACSVERDGSRMSLVKNATVMSYGAEADGVFVTARRTSESQPSDQVLVSLVKGDYQAGGSRSGTRWECAARAARGSRCAAMPTSTRSCPCRTSASTRRAWCRSRI